MRCAPSLPKLVLLVPLVCCGQDATVTGERKVWHAVTLTFTGPATAEDAAPNPFRDYRLSVRFTHAAGGASFTVPGYFAASGDAAAGNK
jgi:hypothetical protein